MSVVDVKFESGVEGLVINNWSCRSDRIRPHSHEEFVIQGDGGCISGDSEDITVSTLEPTPSRIRLQISGKWFPDAFGNSMLHYIDALEQKKPFLCGAHDNLRTVALIEAAYISAKEGREVRLEELDV